MGRPCPASYHWTVFGSARRGVQPLGVARRHEVVLPPRLQQEWRRRREADVPDRLDRDHRLEPAPLLRAGERGEGAAAVLGAGEVRDEPAVGHDENARLEPPLDADEERAHRPAVADAQVAEPTRVHVRARHEQVHRALQVGHELHLLDAVGGGEAHLVAPAPRERGVERHHHRPVARQQRPVRRHLPGVPRHSVHQQDPRERARALGHKQPPRGAAGAARAEEAQRLDLHTRRRADRQERWIVGRRGVVGERGQGGSGCRCVGERRNGAAVVGRANGRLGINRLGAGTGEHGQE